MRILIANKGGHEVLGSSYGRGFENLGHQVFYFDPFTVLNKNIFWRNKFFKRLFEKSILKSCTKLLLNSLLKYDTDIIWIGKGQWALPSLWINYKKLRPETFLVCYNGDNPVDKFSYGGNKSWIKNSIRCFDIFITYNRNLIDPLKKNGAKIVMVLPFAWDKIVYPEINPSPEDFKKYNTDVIYVGNLDKLRVKILEKIVQICESNSWTFAFYGRWDHCKSKILKKHYKGKGLYGVEQTKAIKSSKVAVNILRTQNFGSHNMRTFDIPGNGGVMLSQFSEEQHEFFPNHEAALYFNKTEEIEELLSMIINDKEKRDKIAANAHKIAVKNQHIHRAKMIINKIEELKSTINRP